METLKAFFEANHNGINLSLSSVIDEFGVSGDEFGVSGDEYVVTWPGCDSHRAYAGDNRRVYLRRLGGYSEEASDEEMAAGMVKTYEESINPAPENIDDGIDYSAENY